MGEESGKRRAGRPRAEEAEQKRRGLIMTALEEFARAGYHAASLRDIAEKAQVSSRTLYNHYPDKLALFAACLEYSSSQIQMELPHFDGDLERHLVAYATEVQRHLSQELSLQIATLIYREGTEFEALREIARVQFEQYQVGPVAVILKDHGVPAADCHELAKQFVAMAFGEWQRRLLFGGPVMSEAEMLGQAQLVAQIFLRGICRGT